MYLLADVGQNRVFFNDMPNCAAIAIARVNDDGPDTGARDLAGIARLAAPRG